MFFYPDLEKDLEKKTRKSVVGIPVDVVILTFVVAIAVVN